MNVKLWLAGAVSAAAVTTGFATAPAAMAATHPARFKPVAAPFRQGNLPLARTPFGTLSGDWAGYIALAHKGVRLRYAAASFNIPNVSCTATPDGAVVQSVGLDGYNSPAASAGIGEGCTNGAYSVNGFYQIDSTTGFSTATVSAGDAITASVYYNTSTKIYEFTVTDVTTGQQIISADSACPSGDPCSDNSAETYSGLAGGSGGPAEGTAPLGDYGMENFTGAAVTSFNGTKGTLANSKLWNSDALRINLGNGTLASASPLAGGSAFATTWLGSGAS